MVARAPRLGQIEIPLTLFSDRGVEIQCSCINISSTGALLRMLSDDHPIEMGMQFRSKMIQRGELVDVWMQVERIADEGVGVRFLEG